MPGAGCSDTAGPAACGGTVLGGALDVSSHGLEGMLCGQNCTCVFKVTALSSGPSAVCTVRGNCSAASI